MIPVGYANDRPGAAPPYAARVSPETHRPGRGGRLGNASTNRVGRDSRERPALSFQPLTPWVGWLARPVQLPTDAGRALAGGRQKRVSSRRLVPLPPCHCIARAWRHGVEPVGVSSPGYAESEVAPGLPSSSECALRERSWRCSSSGKTTVRLTHWPGSLRRLNEFGSNRRQRTDTGAELGRKVAHGPRPFAQCTP